MFARRKAGKRFSLLLLEDEEFYVADWVASCGWPAGVPGNWGGAARLPGRLRLATKSLFFEPDDARVPIVRCGCWQAAGGRVCTCACEGGPRPSMHLWRGLVFSGGKAPTHRSTPNPPSHACRQAGVCGRGAAGGGRPL
jgi:hypothetical protein